MNGNVPSHCHTHCASSCCAHRPKRGIYILPIPIGVLIDEDYETETEPLFLHPYTRIDHFHYQQLFPARRSRWHRRVEEEEGFGGQRRANHAHGEPRKNRAEVCKNCVSNKAEKQDEYLHNLAKRLEALELGLQDLTRTRNAPAPAPAPAEKPQRTGGRRKGRQVARSNPATETSLDLCSIPPHDLPSRAEEKVSQKKRSGRSVMNPEEAAVIIQSGFRAYLVRRSQRLRNLRNLAMVKSTLNDLNRLFVDARYQKLLCRDPGERKTFSERATALLLKVDSIRGSEVMVREARRSLSRELVTLLDSVDHIDSQASNAGANMRSKGRRRSTPSMTNTEDIVANERVKLSGDYCECSEQVPFPPCFCLPDELMTEKGEEEEEEEMTSGHSHGPRQYRSNEFDTFRYANRKTCNSNRRRNIGSPRDEEMTEMGLGCHHSPPAFPF